MKPVRLTIIVVCVLAGFGWGIERSRATQLRLQLDQRRRENAELGRLQREHDRLLGLQPSDEELARLRRDAAAAAMATMTSAAKTGNPPQTMTPGTWVAASEWKNCGRATSGAALETMLWASAGGDLAELKRTLEFDDASRAKAGAMLARLPEATRQQYATPEDLLALMVAGNVPLDSAQRVARQQLSENDAMEYVRLKSPAGTTRQVCLALHRGPDGWSLRVPATAVDVWAKVPDWVPAP